MRGLGQVSRSSSSHSNRSRSRSSSSTSRRSNSSSSRGPASRRGGREPVEVVAEVAVLVARCLPAASVQWAASTSSRPGPSVALCAAARTRPPADSAASMTSFVATSARIRTSLIGPACCVTVCLFLIKTWIILVLPWILDMLTLLVCPDLITMCSLA
ncbi:hypothetical protein CLOM_g9481 [Closterium sp. NIES-68]|nr:hypothetical protein CLOM_g9481 [Closterium sp. NIES-68]GJP84868.1 hypothetical protein CLOP_g14916 [Closterium sp. NIES-67]